MTDKGLFHTCYTTQGVFVGDFTPGVIEYQHEWQEGPQKASFVLETGKNGVTDSGLRAWFERRIMWHAGTVKTVVEPLAYREHGSVLKTTGYVGFQLPFVGCKLGKNNTENGWSSEGPLFVRTPARR